MRTTCPPVMGSPPRGCVVHALINPRVEALEGLVGIVGFPEVLVVLGQVCGQDPHVVSIEVDKELERDCSRVSCEGVLEGREVGVAEIQI